MKYRRILAVCLVTFVLYGFTHKQEKYERTALKADPVSKPESSLNQSAWDTRGDWLTFIGSDRWDLSYETDLDDSGNPYVLTNQYESTDGGVVGGELNDIVVTKLSPVGSVEWDIAVNADPTAWADRILLDGEDNFYITGTSAASWGNPLAPLHRPKWRALRKWGVPAEYRPGAGSVFVSLVSVAFSRSVNLLPGLLFGSPDVIQVDETRLNEQQNRSLVRIGSATYLVMAAAGWLPTIVTALIQRLPLSDAILEWVGALEAFLLILFAVAIEGLFLELLAISDGIGTKLKNSNRLVWALSLAACTFFFLHTLLNPRYGLVETLRHGNTALFMGVAIAFILLTEILRFTSRRSEIP